MATTPTFPSGLGPIGKTIVNADSTNYVDVYDNSAASTSVRVEALSVCSDEPTAAVNIMFALHNGSTAVLLGTARAVALSGTDGAVARVNALPIVGTIAADGIYAIEIPPGCKLQAASKVAVTSAKTVSMAGWVRKYV